MGSGVKRNFRMAVEYEGTRYRGFQKQDQSDMTIQGKLEAVLSRMTEKQVEVRGSGRTDAGVHARGQIISVFLDTKMSPVEIRRYMNEYLPEDIGILRVDEVPERFHARLLAKRKTYCYRVLNSEVPSVLERKYVYQIPERLDVEAMRRAASLLCGTHDFQAFTSAKKGKKSTVRTIYSIAVEEVGREIRFTFEGDGFLYHMVRIVMGTLVQVGQGERKPEDITSIMQSGSRENAGPLLLAKGLTLMNVSY